MSTLNRVSTKYTAGFDAYTHSGNLRMKMRVMPNTVYVIHHDAPSLFTWVYCTWVWRLDSNPHHFIYYNNGEEISVSDRTDTIMLATTGPDKLVMGRILTSFNGYYGNVEIDDLIIITAALSKADVMDLYTSQM